MKRILLLYSLFALTTLQAEMSLEGSLDALKPKYEKFTPQLKTIILLGNPKDFDPKPQDKPGIFVKNISIPGDKEKLETKLSPFLEKETPLTQDTLTQIKQTIIRYYRDQDRPVMMVISPQQNLNSGVLQLVVIESKLGEVEFSGNRHFSTSLLQKYVRLKPGDPIDSSILLSDVSWMNRNPFRHTDVILTPGEEQGTTNIRLITKDRRTFRLFAGGDNTGNDFTGNMRYYGGFNWANAFAADQIFTYQYTASEDFHKFQSHTINYVIPLPWRNILNIYGGYSLVHPDLHPFKNHGKSAQGSVRYSIPAGPSYDHLVQDWTVGADYKWTNNELIFGSTFLGEASGIAVVGQAMGQYHFSYEASRTHVKNKVGFDTEIFWSPGHILPHQTTADYQKLRADAKPTYVFGRISLEDICTFYRWQLNVQFRGQIASQNLLPSEQFGLGGFNTVRGYQERLVNRDNGLCANVELRLPSFPLLPRLPNDFTFLGFIDYGLGKDHQPVDHKGKWQPLLGVGPGARYIIGPFLTARCDWAFPLIEVGNHKKKQRLHFALMINY